MHKIFQILSFHSHFEVKSRKTKSLNTNSKLKTSPALDSSIVVQLP